MTNIGDPTFDAYLDGELQRALNILGSTGVRVVVATVPYSRGGEKPDGRLYPEDRTGSGQPVEHHVAQYG